MASVTFKRTNNIDSVPITDGQLIFDTSDQKIYLDNGNTREVYGGGSGTDLISNVSDATDNNAFNANATVNLFTRKSSIVDTKAEIQSVTQAGVPLGCKGFNEVIGTGDISALGDGSVTGAILANKSAIDTVNQNLTKINTSTKTLWGYINGQWVDLHIRAYYDSIPIWKNGNFGIAVENGVYNTVSANPAYGGFVINDESLYWNLPLSQSLSAATLVVTDKIDFSAYTSVKVKYSQGGGMLEATLNVSGYDSENYLCVDIERNSSNAVLKIMVSSQKPLFADHVVDNLVSYGTLNVGHDVDIHEIILE